MIATKDLEDQINNFKIYEVNFESVLKYKQLINKIPLAEKEFLWNQFTCDLELINFNDYSIAIEKKLFNKKDYPKYVIEILIGKVSVLLNNNTDSNFEEKLKELKIKLSNLYIKYEDLQDDIKSNTDYLYEIIENKFSWLDDDEEFEKIADLLESISLEICKKIQNQIDDKYKFYIDYINTTHTIKSNDSEPSDLNIFDLKKSACSYIGNFISVNFTSMFDQICLDVLESNGITNEKEISTIIGIYYDYVKYTTKLYIALYEIKLREEMFNSYNEK